MKNKIIPVKSGKHYADRLYRMVKVFPLQTRDGGFGQWVYGCKSDDQPTSDLAI